MPAKLSCGVLLLLQIALLVGSAGRALAAEGWVQATPATSPPPRTCPASAYDPARGEFVVFGGVVPGGVSGSLNDSWVWNGATWTQRMPAVSPDLVAIQMAYDAARGQVVLLGVGEGSDSQPQTWVWEGVTWTRKFPAMSPPPRVGAGMTFDAARSEVVLFGGSFPNLLGDTWIWNGAT